MKKLEKLGLAVNGEVTLEGWEVFSEFLDQVKPYPILTGIFPSPFGIFEKYLSKIVPACIELVLIHEEKVYFSYREDKYYKGHHIPGTYIAPKEIPIITCQRIADRELPGIKITATQNIGSVNHFDNPRFHDVSLVAVANFEGKIKGKKGGWFNINNPPQDLIGIHQHYVPIIKSYIITKKF